MAVPAPKFKRWFLNSPLFNNDLYRYYLSNLVNQGRYVARRARLSQVLATTLVADVRTLARARGWPVTLVRPKTVQRREASRTISDEMLDIVRNGSRRVRESHQSRAHHYRARGEMFYAHLYSETRYPVDETFTVEIPNAMVFGPGGFTVTPQLELLKQSSFEHPHGPHRPLVTERPDAASALPGLYVSLLAQNWSSNYSHWFIDSLPRLAMLDPARDDYKVIVPPGVTGFQRETLQLLGIGPERVVEMPARYGHLVVERLLLCVAQQRSTQPHLDYITALRDRMLRAVLGDTRHPQPWRRIYISRANSSRKIINEPELLPILQAYGFEVVFTEKLTMEEEVRLFAEARVVVGAHGAGMINPIFCNPGAIVVELFNRERWHHCICRVNSMLGNQHWHLFGDNVGGRWDTRIEPDRLRKLLRYALSGDDLPDALLHDTIY